MPLRLCRAPKCTMLVVYNNEHILDDKKLIFLTKPFSCVTFSAKNHHVNRKWRQTTNGHFSARLKMEYIKRKRNYNVNNLKQFRKKTIGRRIVDISYFGKQFDEGCVHCGTALSFNIVQETIMGLCSIFYLCCKECDKITKISTSDVCDGDGRTPYSIHAKMALGMYNIWLFSLYFK